MRRVVITGIGLATPLGHSVGTFWATLVSGQSAIGPITGIPTAGLRTSIAAEIKDFDPSRHFAPSQLALLDRFAQLGVVAARSALADAGLTHVPHDAARTATIIGSGVGGQITQDEAYWRVYGEKAARVHPFTIPRLMLSAAASHITMDLGLTGPAFAVASACASATHAIGLAFHVVRDGTVERAVTGGTEACLAFGTMKGWEALRVMADDTCRPFARGRRGMVLGEGAAMFVLEPEAAAVARGARVYAELAGFGMTADAGDIIQPSLAGISGAMRAALADARLAPEDIDYVNAHGTGTQANDAIETQALHVVFGDYARRLLVSSTKSMHGHALGAAGGIELAATVLALGAGIAPPTANHTEADPACDLDYVPNVSRAHTIRAAMSNSFAFGGLNAVLIVRRR
ncbi:MAG: beta-ketoacyl-[acyl-carrier-protein] synthase family protein [Alphaproteobacteria bacterium]|nr:beta-ketoacyl-[acyl-carrier-protein] synthase family protein [Alphaproteobacteria bacterium]